MKRAVFIICLLLASVPFIPSLVHAGGFRKDYLLDYKKGLALYAQGRYEKALDCFEYAIDNKFDFWQSYQMVGYCYFELREKDSAMEAFEKSLEINPYNPKLIKIYNQLKSGNLEVPLRPVGDTALAKTF